MDMVAWREPIFIVRSAHGLMARTCADRVLHRRWLYMSGSHLYSRPHLELQPRTSGHIYSRPCAASGASRELYYRCKTKM